MTRLVPRALLALILPLLGSCAGGTVGVSAAYPDGYWDGPAYDYDFDYFYGAPGFYGGWGPGYYIGPPRWDGHPYGGWDGHPGGFPHGDGHGPARPVPSIPTGPRGPGMRGGMGR
jgi:hypothetical protein